ncbi:Polysaccharide biosynthesis protein [Musa troglodytarum]|uniref:Polysaccharide biosynthesis protein n=1 Tax=Musa troglodytarum TaxID=320322 RepID=A0A9E7ENL9_9LILI|nr:Polysaccharide biosynthesis protein [Musa troglodytarum]URD80382.1 Polysaccharide biosynthesis protein [Musa troglodytarum]
MPNSATVYQAMVKVLVTGATGYLGGRLCHRLLEEGHLVRAFLRRSSDLSYLPSSHLALELAYGDVTDLPSLIDALHGCDVLFHTAALVEPWILDTSRFFAVNVGGLRNVLQAFQATKTLQKIIYTSSFFALGPTDGYVADEKQMHQGKMFCTEYEKSKVVADGIALQAAADGTPIVLLYPGVIYGSGKLTSGNFIAKLAVRVLRHQWAYSCDKAKAELGYSPRRLHEGLSEILLWLKELEMIRY